MVQGTSARNLKVKNGKVTASSFKAIVCFVNQNKEDTKVVWSGIISKS